MNLMEESFQNKEEKKKRKLTTILLVLIFIVLIVIIGIIAYLSYYQSGQLKVYLNGKVNDKIKETLLIRDDGSVYVQIREIAKYLDYSSYQGDYIEKSEEKNKCYIQNKNEIAGFELNSNKIYKLDLSENDNNYEYYYIKNPVIAKDGILYTTSEGIEKAFNTSFEYDRDKNTIKIFTTPYLVEKYSPKVLDNGYKQISKVFANQKAILKDMIVVEKDDKTKGVISVQGKQILEAKYNDILYLPGVGDFLVETNGKYGVLSDSGSTKIKPRYDSIKLMDIEAGLYLVSIDNKYGVLDLRGNLIVDINNDEIGMDISKFERNEITNKYILADNMIPVRKNKTWGMYDKKGNQIVDFKYDSFGYISTDKNLYSLLVIQDYNVVVACKDKKYTLLKPTGEELFGTIADDIYMTIKENQKQYTIYINNKEIDAIEFLKSQGISYQKKNDQEDNEKQDRENNANDNVEAEADSESEENNIPSTEESSN